MLKLKKGDTIKVVLGRDHGREGVVEKVNPKEKTVLVPGVNMYKRAIKGTPGREGGIYDLPRPLAFPKVALVCPHCKKETRVGFSIVDNIKHRICKKCGREIDSAKPAQKGGKKQK